MIEHGTPRNRLKNLRKSGMHAFAHAGSENDDIHFYPYIFRRCGAFITAQQPEMQGILKEQAMR